MSGLIWIQTVWHPDGLEEFLKNLNFEKNLVDNEKNMQN